MNAGCNWTPERVNTLTKLWTSGFSASQIAREMGDVTKNAVLGKVFRLGFPKRRVDISPERKRELAALRKERAAKRDRGRVRNASRTPGIRRSATRIVEQVPPPEFKHVQFVDLEPHHCRFIHGTDPKSMTFCGNDKTADSSWCAYHHRIVWREGTAFSGSTRKHVWGKAYA